MTDFLVLLSANGDGEATRWVMNPALKAFLAIGIVVFYIVLIVMLKRKTLVLRYTLLWMFSGLVLLIFLLFPQVVLGMAELIGVSNPVNAVFLLFAGFALLLILSLTSIVSQISDKNRTLIQQVALLEKRVRELEEKQTDKKK